MEAAREPSLRPIGEVIGAGVMTGTIAGLATGAIDAIWSWRPAAQFVPGLAGRMRFVLFGATSHAVAGAAAGLVLATALLVLSRATRLGTLLRFAFADHNARRVEDPRVTVVGLSVVLVGVPCAAATLWFAYRATVTFITNRHVIQLEVIVAMAAALGAIAIAVPITFLAARILELGLARIASRARFVSSVWAPFAALAVMIGLVAIVWAQHDWETARVLPLRPPLVAVLGLGLAIAVSRPAAFLVVRIATRPAFVRRATWAALPVVLVVLVLAIGSSPAVIKSVSAYTGLGGPIARTLRSAFDWDRDGYSRFLGGGDCDDSDASIHPGALEIPDDGIDQNCVGGDATTRRSLDEVAFAPVPPSVPKDFDVLVITIDTTRADHLGMYGYSRPTSPNLDRLAKDGTVFDHGWAHAPSTRYSMPAILTGRLPLDVYYDTSVAGWPGLLPRATTIAESLKPFGFVTGAITNYDYFDKSRHMDQGVDEYDNEDARLHGGIAGVGPERTRGSSSKEQSDKAIGFVDRHASQRWFLWVHYYDPHADYEPHKEIPPFGTTDVDLYDGELRFTDLHIGRVLDDLRAKGLYDKTVIIVTGDHGEGFGEHNVTKHGYHLYSPQTKVPVIVRVPGLPARRSTTPAGHVDILPTLVNLAGGTPTPDMEGRSLVDALAGSDRDRTVFQQLSYENNHEMRAGVSRLCHVIYNVSPDPSWEVYRVDRDPIEAEDLAGDDDECADTRHAVEHWYDLEQVPAGAAEALLLARPAIARPLDADLGTSVRLLAVDAPATAHPGDSLSLTWTFEARGAVAAGWKMFVHAEGPNKVFYIGDHRPARPFEWWHRGQFVRYTTTLTIPKGAPLGHYNIMAGMFEGPHRAVAHAPTAKIVDNAVTVATVEVVP